MAAKLLLNAGLIFCLLIAPVFLSTAIGYRKGLGKPVFIWQIPEMVLVTIIFFASALLLSIIGVSSFFSHLGFFNTIAVNGPFKVQFLTLGISCVLLLIGLGIVYLSLRKIMVQVVVDRGILLNEKVVPMPNSSRLITWDQISDYYLVSDYPNAIFNLIIKDEDLSLSRHSIKVPIFLKDDFQTFIEKQLHSAHHEQTDDARISRPFFSEN